MLPLKLPLGRIAGLSWDARRTGCSSALSPFPERPCLCGHRGSRMRTHGTADLGPSIAPHSGAILVLHKRPGPKVVFPSHATLSILGTIAA